MSLWKLSNLERNIKTCFTSSVPIIKGYSKSEECQWIEACTLRLMTFLNSVFLSNQYDYGTEITVLFAFCGMFIGSVIPKM